MSAPHRCAILRLWLAIGLLAAASLGCARSTNEVIAYVAIDRSRAEPILKEFEKSSGVKVRAVYDGEAAKTTGLVARLLSESDHPRCDVFWNNELAQTCLLAQAGALAAYDSPAAEDIPAALKPDSRLWTPVALRARVIVYNTQHVAAAEMPRSIFELTEPKWRGKVAIANPQFGTTRAHIAALFAVLGPERAKQFLEQLLANDVQIVDGNAMVKNLVGRYSDSAGGVLVGLTDTDDVREGQAAGEPVGMVFPDADTIGTFLCPCTVCLVKNAPHDALAKRLADYLSSAEVEARLCGPGSGYLPVRASRESSEGETAAGGRWFDISDQQLLDNLENSSRWTLEHFRR